MTSLPIAGCHARAQYVVALFPSNSAGFQPDSDAYTSLQTVPVEIVTAYAGGPHPVAYTRPQYDRVAGEDGHGKAWGDMVPGQL